MPAIVKTKEDEKKWKEAKDSIIRQYPDRKLETLYPLIMDLFLKMIKKNKDKKDE